MREKRYYKGMKRTQGKEEERKEKEKEKIGEVFAGAGLEMKETERGNYPTAFSIKGKLII
jgi:hypothetical protein